jgi:hypothetical protein
MNQELRDSFGNILKAITRSKLAKMSISELEDSAFIVLDLKNIAIKYCECEPYEFLGIMINATRESDSEGLVDIDKHNEYCKALDLFKDNGLDIDLL